MTSEFGDRIRFVIGQLGGVGAAAKIAGRSSMQMSRYAKGHEPPLGVVVALAEAAKLPVQWLAQGIEPPSSVFPTHKATLGGLGESGAPFRGNATPRILFIDRIAPRLKPGWQGGEDRFTVIEKIPFPGRFHERAWDDGPRHLVILQLTDDTMSPTAKPGDWVLADTHDDGAADGLFVISINGVCHVRRLALQIGGDIHVLCDNKDFYPSETLSRRDFDRTVSIVGRIRWIGQYC